MSPSCSSRLVRYKSYRDILIATLYLMLVGALEATVTEKSALRLQSMQIPTNSSMTERGEITYNSSYDRLTRFCTCSLEKTTIIDCDNKEIRENFVKTRWPKARDRTKAIWRRSMAAGPPQKIPYPLYDSEHAFVPNEPIWPTPSGLHEVDAIKICQDAMNKIEGLKKCQTIAKVDFKGIIEMCVEDIKISDDIKLTQVATTMAIAKCKDFVTKDPFLLTANSTQDLLQDLLCPGDCSGDGICTNGTCMCKDSFIGDDCSLDSSKAPFVSTIVSGDQCDVNKSPCEAVYVSGSNFHDGTSSSCHLLELSFKNGSFEETGQVFHTDVDYITTSNVGCFLPAKIFVNDKSTVAYTFSITNDRTRYSQNKTVIVYDSGCLDCDAKLACKIKSESCLIDGNCYRAKEAMPGDSSYRCDPKLNNTHWTNQRMP
ncbi:hypothetical protein CHS0354_036994 [Potamilus streckersoni]|uniref:Vwde helical domain-containing protein n=1 Tax=Potamilus streckersoni TaxID=2493646 RepID=A0AAE0SKZ3_9BIVA|nr:hypothetical protein CHS0354_036994 [Potamilus streckersoni]